MSEVSSSMGNEGVTTAVALALPFPFSTVEKVDTASLTHSSEDEASFAEKAGFSRIKAALFAANAFLGKSWSNLVVARSKL
jgi:hypothetical protein